MSIRLMTKVWDDAADVASGALIVLLAMADWANDDGTGIYPKQETLAKKARLGPRQVRNVLAELEERGYIERVGKRGHVIEWRMNPDPANIASRQPTAGRQPIATSSGNGLPTEPSTEPSKEEANASPSKARGLNEVYGKPETPGSAAAPWLVLELARLMRQNDEKVRLPAGVKKAVVAWEKAQGHEHASPSLAMRVLEADGWHPSLKPWLDSARLLVDTDGRPAREVAQVLRFTQTDDFWKVNVLSMPKFREKYSQVRGKALGAVAKPAPAERGPTTRAQLDLIVERNRPRDDDDAQR